MAWSVPVVGLVVAAKLVGLLMGLVYVALLLVEVEGVSCELSLEVAPGVPLFVRSDR